jgi:hypothetical protein
MTFGYSVSQCVTEIQDGNSNWAYEPTINLKV